jgi:hypothetical protein
VFAAANASTTVMILKGDGMLYVSADAGGTDYYVGIWDEEQDALACRDLAYGLGGRWDKVLSYQAPALEKMGIMQNGLLSVQASTALTLSGVSEVYQVLDRLCRRFGLTYEALRQEVRQCQKA